jgi:aminomethyltransferase
MEPFVAGGGDVSMETLATNGILALQGPKAAAVLQRLTAYELKTLTFGFADTMAVAGIADCYVARSGYTGEDGFEIAVPKGDGPTHNVVTLWEALMADAEVMPVGLGARDSLRLEAGLCLYGNDLDTTTSPAEGSLFWVVNKKRRTPGAFVGSERILEEIANKSATRKRAGFSIKGAPARAGTPVLNADGDEVGVVTSGSHSPILKTGIGMAYVRPEYNKVGTELYVMLRKKKQTITITKMPFVPQNYYRGE